MALDIRLTLIAEWSGQKVALTEFADPLDWWRDCVQVTRTGTLTGLAEPDLVATSFIKALQRGQSAPGSMHLSVHSDIPLAQGLGSSAAAAVAGSALAEVCRDGQADRNAVFQDAIEIEGHADNAAAATYGGVQAALLFGDRTRATSVRVHDSIRVAVCVPREMLKESTSETRSWLPEKLKRKEAVSNQRALLTLLYGLRTAEAAAIEAGFEDRLHVPHRKSMIAGYDDIVKSAVKAGAFGCTISGAGGSMIALGIGDMQPVADAMRAAYKRHGMSAQALTPAIDRLGLTVELA